MLNSVWLQLLNLKNLLLQCFVLCDSKLNVFALLFFEKTLID